MTQECPEERALTRWQQLWLVAGLVVVLSGFLMATRVEPDPRGFGTHQQFGLPPCSFYDFFGIPCPSCGGTTCASHFVRGEWVLAADANPGVFGLMLVSLAYVPWAGVSLRKRRYIAVDDPLGAAIWILLTLGVITAVQWILRLL